MNNSRLKKRLFFKKATPLKDRAVVKNLSRRDHTFVKLEEEHPNDEFETFFQFEEDLSDLKSSSEQFQIQEDIDNINPVTMEVQQEFFTVMEDIEEPITEKVEKTNNSLGIVLDEISYCEFNETGKSCSNEKSENSIYCDHHKQELINKIKLEQNMD